MSRSLSFAPPSVLRHARGRLHYGSTLSTNFINLGLGVLTGVLTARGLLPSQRGELVALVVWSSAIALASMIGVDEAIIRASSGDDGMARSLRRSLRSSVIAQAVAGTLALFAISLLIVRVNSWEDVGIALLVSAMVPLNAVNQLCLAPLRVAGDLRRWNLLRLLPQTVYAIGVSLHVATGTLSVIAGISWLICGVTLTAILCIQVDRNSKVGPPWKHEVAASARAFGRRLVPGNLLYQTGPRFDQLLLGVAFAAGYLGIYSIAAGIASIVMIFAITLDQLLFPRWSAAYPSTSTVDSLVWRVVIVGTPICGLLWLVSPLAISWIYGNEYASAAQPLGLLLVAAMLRVASSVLNAALKAAGATSRLLIANGSALLVGCGIFPLAYIQPLLGTACAALAAAMTQIIMLRRSFHRLQAGGKS